MAKIHCEDQFSIKLNKALHQASKQRLFCRLLIQAKDDLGLP